MTSGALQDMNPITELNFSYLLLAQRLINDDEAEAVYKLGVSKELAGLLARLTPAQMVRLANTATLLCRCRLDERSLLATLGTAASQHDLQQMHMAILLAAQPVESIN
ncbi:Flagellar transcriptional regulator FlhD [compost metagenome]